MKLVKGSIDVWARRKQIYDRHQAGESIKDIALDFGITPTNAASLSNHWARILEIWQDYQQDSDGHSSQSKKMLSKRHQRLLDAGLLNGNKRSPEYGYA